MKRNLLILLLFLFSKVAFGQTEIFALYNAAFENDGYWQDSVIYDLNGKPQMVVRGTAVVDKSGGIVGWTDNAGILFGLDGQMKGFTLRSPKNPVLYKENINFPVTISDGNIFIPLNCYDFIPLEKKELAARISSGPKATPIYIPSATSNGEGSSVRANETFSSRVIATIGVREAGSVSMSGGSLSNSNSSSSSSSNSSFSSKISSLNSIIENRRQIEADQQEANRRRNSESNVGSQIFYAPSGTQPSNEIVFSNLTEKLILGERIFLSGAPITQKDSISLKYFSMSAPNELPQVTKVYAYNIGYKLFAEADRDYNSSLKNFQTALEHYKKGEFMEAMQYAAQATKTRTKYVNAYVLASASAKMNQYYDLALDYLNAVDDQEYKGQIEALSAEIYYLKGDQEKADKLLKKSYSDNAKDWSFFIRKKYNISEGK